MLVFVVVFVLAGFIALTWKHLVENLCVGLTGNSRLIKSMVFVEATFFAALALIIKWFFDHPELLHWIGSITCFAVLLKLIVAGWATQALGRQRIISPRSLMLFGAVWISVAGMLSAAMRWLLPSELISTSTLILSVVLLMPLARLMLAPLALVYNRHK
jgi:hypothetical protein